MLPANGEKVYKATSFVAHTLDDNALLIVMSTDDGGGIRLELTTDAPETVNKVGELVGQSVWRIQARRGREVQVQDVPRPGDWGFNVPPDPFGPDPGPPDSVVDASWSDAPWDHTWADDGGSNLPDDGGLDSDNGNGVRRTNGGFEGENLSDFPPMGSSPEPDPGTPETP
jgi:hypothetical protein